MSEALSYDEKVVHTFRKTALRTVLMIDDQFPTFSDLAQLSCDSKGQSCGMAHLDKKFSERERAFRLYQMFRSHDMPCDIENDVINIEHDKDVERIRKSDLVILDYNLSGDHNDNKQSIALIHKLADTSHFNTIVVYTMNPDLDQVWFDVACSLKGGWRAPDDFLKDNDAALKTWETLSDQEAAFPNCSFDLLKCFVVGDENSAEWKKARSFMETALLDLQVARKDCTALIAALVHRDVRTRLSGAARNNEKPRTLSGRCEKGKTRWLQAGNCFIAIMGKQKCDTDGTYIDDDGIIAHLDAALQDWRPNLLQIIISEIQNILELEALATDELHLQNPEIQTGLFYYLLTRIGGPSSKDNGASFIPGIEAIVDKLIENIRRKISSNGTIVADAALLLDQELKDKKWEPETKESDVYKIALSLTGSPITPKKVDTIFRLNSFLSTEEFKRGHLTTGTVVRLASGEDHHWICMSPACDMEPRKPSEDQFWANGLFPLRAFVAIRLKTLDSESALSDAELGQNLFLQTREGNRSFSLVHGSGKLPSYEIFFPTNEGRVDYDPKSACSRFNAFRLMPSASGEPDDRRHMDQCNFEVVGQIREQYAGRFLQVIGHHLSRIGVDFIKLPT